MTKHREESNILSSYRNKMYGRKLRLNVVHMLTFMCFIYLWLTSNQIMYHPVRDRGEGGIKNGNLVPAYLAGNKKKAHLKVFSAKLSLFSGCFYWDWHSLSPSTCDNTLYFHVLNSIFSTYCNSLDGKQNHNVVSQSNGNTSDCCHELVLKSYILNYIRYLLGSHSLSWKLAVLRHVSNHTTSKKYSLYLFWAVLTICYLCKHSRPVLQAAGHQK